MNTLRGSRRVVIVALVAGLLGFAGKAQAQSIPQTNWSVVYVDSQETSCGNGVGTNIFDGNSSTIWHTQFCPSSAPMPHEIQINLGASYTLTAFQYLPRQDGSACGWIKQYEFYVSADGVNWGTAVASSTFDYTGYTAQCPGPGAGVPPARQVAFPATTGQYIRLRALSEMNGNPWTSMAELNVLGAPAETAALFGVTLKPAIVIGGSGSIGTVILNVPAPSGGLQVALSSSDPQVATVPSSVTIPADSISADFTVSTAAVASSTSATVSASYNGATKTASLAVNSGTLTPQTNWSVVYMDSQETSCGNGVGTNTFDGNSSTIWHTQFCPSSAPMPHEIQINLGASYTLTAFQYLPRQDGSACGWIKQYEFYVSADGVTWGSAVASGTFDYTGYTAQCPGPGAGVPPARQIAFTPTTGQYVRLRALSEVNGHPWTSAAEINLLGAPAETTALLNVTLKPAIVIGGSSSVGTVTLNVPAPSGGLQVALSSSNPQVATTPSSVTIPANSISADFTVSTAAVASSTSATVSASYNGATKTASLAVNSGTLTPQTNWSVVYMDSQETSCGNGAGANTFDGNSSTIWHTQFCPSSAPMPHEIQINLGASYTLTAFQYLPRQDGSACGWIKQYEFYVSADGVNWGPAVASGIFDYSGYTAKCPGPGAGVPPAIQIAFPQTTGRYIRLRALSEINGNPWTAMAEINLLGSTPAPLAITTSSLPSGTQNQAYSASLAATGGIQPYTWSLASGVLPAGLSLSSTGQITGTPVAFGTSSFTVQAEDANSTMATQLLSLAIQPLPPPNITSVTPTTATAGTQITVTGTGFGATQGAGYVWLGSTSGIVVSWSDTQVIALVASGATTGTAKILQAGVWSDAIPFVVTTPVVTSVVPGSGPPGTQVAISGQGFGAAQGDGNVWLGSTYGVVMSWSDTQILATVASSARTGTAKVLQGGVWSNQLAFTVTGGVIGSTVTIVPSMMSLVVGETRTVQALDSTGTVVHGLAWASSDSTIASLSTDDPPVITANAPGHVTLTASDGAADLWVYPGPYLPTGTVKWSNPGDGSGVTRIMPAVPSPTGVADVFALQGSDKVQAITSDGIVAWTADVGGWTDTGSTNLLPDFQGGLVVARNEFGVSYSIKKLDGITGQAYPAYVSSHLAFWVNLAVHTDGTIFAIDWDSLVGIDPLQGIEKFRIPMEHETEENNGCWGWYSSGDFIPEVGQIIIAGDGYA